MGCPRPTNSGGKCMVTPKEVGGVFGGSIHLKSLSNIFSTYTSNCLSDITFLKMSELRQKIARLESFSFSSLDQKHFCTNNNSP